MSATSTFAETPLLVLHFNSVLKRMTADEFYEFCQLNRDLRLELTSEGDLIIMPPTGSKSGHRNLKLSIKLGLWAEQDGTGQAFDSSTGFALPNGAKRSPDFAWIANERWNALTQDEQEKFAPLCPDFVVELRSPTDSLKTLQRKMEEYIANGAQLGWLIDPLERRVYIYRPQTGVVELDNPQTVSGDPALRGLALNLEEIWD
jgi:Uma2 family endonuclease